VWTDESRSIPDRIEAVLDRVAAIWGAEVTVEARVPREIRGEVGRQVVRIVQEATVNAARHGSADSVSVTVWQEEGHVHIRVVDTGAGFSFRGEYDHDQLKEQKLGPLSLKHRVEEAGGRISIRSTPGGSTVQVRIPLVRRRDA
jgi:signal transduction histidine kinase